jgi:hypothetical protein
MKNLPKLNKMLMKLTHQGSISPTFYEQLLETDNLTVFFALLGSAGVKDAC